MNRIVIFSGTTEGRMLAQTLSENGIHCIVFVATEYGESVMPEMDGVTVHKGRMDLEKMQKFIAQSEVAAVVDATHPFATAVSENIRESLKNTEIPYIRLQRETSDIALNKDTIQENHSDVILCSDATECADFLNFTDGNILLTTGSKDLATYSQNEALKDRLFVRVLPGLESISLCEQNGICGKQIIAMQGPFSLEMNRALIRQFHIRYLVTKESGRTGGFLEKIKAAEAEGITACVIGNPEKQNSGMSCGCVVLAPDTGAVREVLSDGQNGFLYPSGRRMNWVMLITLLLERRSELLSIRRNARKTVFGKHNKNTLLPRHIAFLMDRYNHWRAQQTQLAEGNDAFESTSA